MGRDEAKRSSANDEQLFVKDGLPVGFFFHRSIKSVGQRVKLQADIEAYGGRVVPVDKHADTVLVDAKYDQIHALRDVYNISDDPVKRKIFVERLSFVQRCIRGSNFIHRLPTIKPMGGNARKSRIPFIPEDDEHLAGYIARKLPDVDAGGRKGEAIYHWLFEVAELNPREYEWVFRHTPDSWRERYRNNVEVFDERIAEIVKVEKTSRKQLWLEDRRLSMKRRKRMKMEEEEEVEVEEEEDEESEEGEADFVDGDGGEEIEERKESESEDESEASLQPTKRRRSHLDTPIDQVAKKRRLWDNTAMQQTTDKGTRKVVVYNEGDGSDEEIHNTSLFSIDEQAFEATEPGPSHPLPSPDRTLAEGPARRQHSPEPSRTQVTLVDFETASHSTSANKRYSGDTMTSILLSREERLLPPAVQQSQRHMATRMQFVGPQPVPPNEPSQPLQQSEIPLNRQGPRPRPKQRHPFAVVQENEAPYRNTRSRSHSVEPVAFPPPKPKQKVLKKNEAIPEEVDVFMTGAVPTTDTLEEEMDVENLLTNHTHQSTRPRASSLETDDAQTKRVLGGKKLFTSNQLKLADIRLKLANRRSMLATQQPSMQSAISSENQRPHHIEQPQARHRQMAANTLASDPHTPINRPHVRGQSTSSTEFPLPGTRASGIKKARKEEEKHTPYKPLRGTRAAAVTQAGRQ